jgi:predicted transcriptional regulator
MAKKDDFTHFTFRLDRALREKAERLAEEDSRALGVWVSLVIADKVAAAEAARAPSRKRSRDPLTSDRPRRAA